MSNPYLGPRLPSEFRVPGGPRRTAAPFAVLLIPCVFIVVVSVLISSPIGIGIGLAGVLIVVFVLAARFGKAKPGPVVRFSHDGVELSDARGFRVRLRWADVTEVGTVYLQLAGRGAIRPTGLIGWGERVVPPDIPAWLRATLAAEPVNPVDGRPRVSIPLGGIDPLWQQGAMGEWVRWYRPDLLTPTGQRSTQP